MRAQPVPARITPFYQPVAGGPAIFDAGGNLYYTGSSGQVTAGAAQTKNGGGMCFPGPEIMPPQPCPDAWVAKVGVAGNLIFGTLLGGPTTDQGTALAVDSSGNVFVAGTTGGSFPTTANAAIAASTTAKAFAAKISADGSHVLYSTYLPDTAATASAIAIDAQGDAYIAGKTTAGHAYVLKVGTDGSSFLYNVVLAGTNQDSAATILADAAGNVIVAGQTSSPDFPVTPGVVQSRLAGARNVFVARLDPSGHVVFSTYLGGSGTDGPAALQTDSAGNIYVAGGTTSLDFPTTSGTFQAAPVVPLWNNSGPGGFIAVLTANGSALVYSSYVMSAEGGLQRGATKLAVTASGEVYVAGLTGAGFPVTASAPQICFDGSFIDGYQLSGVNANVFVAHLDPHGALLDATYAGQDVNGAWALSLAGDGSILLVWGSNGTFNVKSQIRFGGNGWSAPACLSQSVMNAATMAGGSYVAPGELISLTGFGIGPNIGVSYEPDIQGLVPRQLAGVQVFFDGQPAPVLYAQSRQVNALAPVELVGKLTMTNITVVYNGVTVGSTKAWVFYGAPGVFRIHPGASSQAAILNQDGTLNSSSNPAARGSVVALWGTSFGPTDPPCTTGGLNAPGPVNLSIGFSDVLFDSRFTPVLYAGSAPTLLCGVQQVNMLIPTDAEPGAYLFLLGSRMALPATEATAEGQIGLGPTIAVK